MFNPDAYRDVLEPLKVEAIEHVLCDSVAARDALFGDECPGRRCRCRYDDICGFSNGFVGRRVPEVDLLPFCRFVREVDCRGIKPCLRLDQVPIPRGNDKRPGIDAPVPILVAKRPLDRRHFPIRVFRVEMNGCADHEMLHVSPCEIGPHLQRERDNTNDQRCSSGRTTMQIGTLVLADVGGMDVIPASGTRRDDEHRGAHFRIVRVESLAIDCADGQGKDRVGVPVEITLVV